MVYSITQQSAGGNEYGKPGRLSIFTSLRHLTMLYEVQFFQGLLFFITSLLLKTLIACRAITAQIVFNGKHYYYNNAFKVDIGSWTGIRCLWTLPSLLFAHVPYTCSRVMTGVSRAN